MARAEFDRRWEEAARPGATAELGELAQRLFEEFVRPTLDLAALRRTLVRVLRHLCSAEGRSDDNFYSLDAFLCLLTVERDDLLDRLPPDDQGLLDALAMDLHEAYRDPEMAARVGSSPQMLLARAERLGGESVH